MVFRFIWVFSFTLMGLVAKPGYFEPFGKDSELIFKDPSIITPPKSENPLAKAVEGIILFHQNVISPVDGPRSHFRPTSARYALLATRRHGLLKGYLMACDRLIRENKDPWVYRTRVINQKEYKWDPTF